VVGLLTYPSSNSLCIDRNQTNIVEQLRTNGVSRIVILENKTAYYWNVVAFDSEDEAAPSPTFPFFTKGDVILNHSPFATSLGAPTTYSVLSAVALTLDWRGSDVNTDDTLTCDVYFDNANPPVLSEIKLQLPCLMLVQFRQLLTIGE